jgi:hypothetical protein
MQDERKPQSWWTTLPGILSAAAGILTALTGLIVALNAMGLFQRSPLPKLLNYKEIIKKPEEVSKSTLGSIHCFEPYFQGIPNTRVKTLEAGSKNITIIEPEESKTDLLGIQFTENGEPIGAIRLSFFPHNDMFKIAAVMNAKCQEIATYRNETRGQDKNVLQNWDSLAIQFENDTYALRLGYGSGEIRANYFRRISPP